MLNGGGANFISESVEPPSEQWKHDGDGIGVDRTFETRHILRFIIP